ncbi:hypothetical protein BU17DRAFT_84861 [Hysterangium stoloniferum]|nr:hypothetical protein BU17DRAFT_84861 [Hysterangium stoloniferum]
MGFGFSDLDALDLGRGNVIEVDSDVSVDTACEYLFRNRALCLAVRHPEQRMSTFSGLFDSADVNAFLTLAATSHRLNKDDIDTDERAFQILEAAKSGKVPVKLYLSEKNPLVILPSNATVLSLLELFSRGTHRAIIGDFKGDVTMVSDMDLLEWLVNHAPKIASLVSALEQPLSALGIGSRNVVSCLSTELVLDAMKVMSEQGLSTVAVVDDETGNLLSAISVTDIARLVAPSQSKDILSIPLGMFVAIIKAPDGSQDGADRYPAFSVTPTATLSHVIQKLLATNSHRVFLASDPLDPGSPMGGYLRGVVSVVDVLSIFARLCGVPEVDPTRMQRQRRASSSSTSSSRSRSSSRIGRRGSIRPIIKSVSGLDRL